MSRREVRARPVRPRNAASLVILRGEGASTEVLLGKRHSRHRFMPDVYVFPGGAVDPRDHRTPALKPLPDTLRRRLETKWPGTMAQALPTAALRETWEETGLIFGSVQDGALRPDLSQVDLVARAITPVDSPIRFHARFFLARGEAAAGTLADSRELHDLGWVPIAEALTRPLVDVTEFVLQEVERRLQGWQAPGLPLFSYRGGGPRIRYE